MDMALYELGYNWVPQKGYHFPDNPYVEYGAEKYDDQDNEKIIQDVNSKIAEIVSRGIRSEVRFMPKEQMSRYCPHIPEQLPSGKPSRIVLYGNFGVPCGGTHVSALADIGHVTIRKIKKRSGMVRVAYEIS